MFHQRGTLIFETEQIKKDKLRENKKRANIYRQFLFFFFFNFEIREKKKMLVVIKIYLASVTKQKLNQDFSTPTLLTF